MHGKAASTAAPAGAHALGPQSAALATDASSGQRKSRGSATKSTDDPGSLRGPAAQVVPARTRKRPIRSLEWTLFVATLGYLLWTLWLAMLTVHPNDTINEIMNTKSYDDGSFWLLIEPAQMIKCAGVFGFAVVLTGYLFILLKLTLRRKRVVRPMDSRVGSLDAAKHTLNSFKSGVLETISAIASDESRASVARTTASFIVDLTSEATMARKHMNVGIKIGECVLHLVLLVQSLENGYPRVLIYVLTVIISFNAVACVLMMCLKRFQSELNQVLIDCLFASLIAVGFPMLVLVYCLTTFKFDSKKLAINEAIFPPGRYEHQARVIADPVAVANVLNSLNSLRIVSVTSFFTRVGTNLALSFQFVKLATSKDRLNPSLYPYRHPMTLLFALMPIVIVICVSQSIQTSQVACAPHPECVVHAFRWINLNQGDKTQCPCLTLISGRSTPRTFAEWQQPANVMEKVAQLATSGDLRAVQLTNRLLPTLPDELRCCVNLKHLSLIYTQTETLPSWVKEFTKLEYLHVEGALDIVSLTSLPEDIFDHMSALSYVHIAVHPHLRQLPSFRGLVNVRALLLVLLVELEELPAFTSLAKLERLVVSFLVRIETFPDMAPIHNLLGFVLSQSPRVCCNGFLNNQCDLSKRACYLEPAWSSPTLTCLPANRTDRTASDATRTLFTRFSTSVCPERVPPAPKEGQYVQEADVNACSDTLYRQCTKADGRTGICYSLRMMPIACTNDTFPVAMRRRQILENVGDKCDPEVEAWLGCPTS